MRQALLASRNRELAGTSRGTHIGAPLQGWNTRDSLAQMGPLFAIQMENLFPGTSDVRLRNGSVNWANRAAAGDIKSLYSFQSNTAGTNKLFACSDNGIYDASAGGAMGVAVSSLTNGLLEMVNFTNSAGTNYLWGVNGADKVKTYNGTTWADLDGVSVPAITGVTVTNLNFCWIFKRRIFCIEKNTMNAWFLPVDSIAGAMSKFPIGGLFSRGGYLLAGCSWTLDGGNGPDDYCVFITSEGEIAVYAGVDPSTSGSFGLIGVFYVGRPVGRRCFVRVGGDVWVATALGLIPLSKLARGEPFAPKMAVSDPIRPTWSQAVAAYGSQSGWELEVHPLQQALVVNIPLGGGLARQFVINVLTGAWSQFTGWNALCFTAHNNTMYFGGASGVVYEAWSGPTDNGQPIVGQVVQAYNYFQKRSGTSQVKLIRPIISFNGGVEIRAAIYTDFTFGDYTTVIPVDTSLTTAPWDITPWDTGIWSSAALAVAQLRWMHVSARPGFAIAVALQFSSSFATLMTWSGTDYQFADGGVM